MRLFKKKNKIELSWNLTNDLKPNLKNYKDNYDKINALKCFLIRNNFSLDCIDEILENKNPFHEIINHFKQVVVAFTMVVLLKKIHYIEQLDWLNYLLLKIKVLIRL